MSPEVGDVVYATTKAIAAVTGLGKAMEDLAAAIVLPDRAVKRLAALARIVELETKHPRRLKKAIAKLGTGTASYRERARIRRHIAKRNAACARFVELSR